MVPPDSGQWEVVTPAVLPDAVRASLELRVQGEEEKQQQQQQGYYFEGFMRPVYVADEVRFVATCVSCSAVYSAMTVAAVCAWRATALRDWLKEAAYRVVT